MLHPRGDAEVERLVQRSVVFRAVRALLLAVDSTAASSAARARDAAGRALAIARRAAAGGRRHDAVLEALSRRPWRRPARYLFAVAGVVMGPPRCSASRVAIKRNWSMCGICVSCVSMARR